MVVLIGRRILAWRDSAKGVQSLRFPLPRQPLRFSDLGRRHPWPLMRQFVSNGIEQRSHIKGLLKRQCAQALSRAQLYEAALEGRSKLSRLIERLQDVSFRVDGDGFAALDDDRGE